MSSQAEVVGRLIRELRNELVRMDYWSLAVPAPEALMSTQPFSVDTLEFHQWLQFIFVARIEAILEGGHALPDSCAVAEMAEYVWAGKPDHDRLISLIGQLDRSITGKEE